jgi:pimeloyl-ACP methyl ester carboxylesterase
MGAGVALAFALAHPERVTGLMLVRPAWLDHPFPPNLRWFPLAAGFLQEYPADEAAQRFARLPEFSELKAASKPAADSMLGQFRRPHARERAGILAGMPASVPVTSLTHCQQLQIPVSVVVNAHDPGTLILSVSKWPRSPAPRSLGSLQADRNASPGRPRPQAPDFLKQFKPKLSP